MTKVLSLLNNKGGCAKTSTTCMVGFELARKGNKVLIIDDDPQGNATDILSKTSYNLTGKQLSIDETMMYGIAQKDLEPAVTQISKHLYMVASGLDFYHYNEYLIDNMIDSYDGNKRVFYNKRISYLSSLLKPVEKQFDYVLIDVPPTIDIYLLSVLYNIGAMNGSIILVMQTQERSFLGVKAIAELAQKFYNDHPEISYQIQGVIPVLMDKRSPIDSKVLDDAEKEFGKDMIFRNRIYNYQRIKRYDFTGISVKNDYHDVRIHQIYTKLTNEILRKIGGK